MKPSAVLESVEAGEESLPEVDVPEDVSEDNVVLLTNDACEDASDDVATLLVLLLLIALLMISFDDCTEYVELGAAVLEVSFEDCAESVELETAALEASVAEDTVA